MKAAVVREVGELSIEDIDTPDPGPGEVLIRLVAWRHRFAWRRVAIGNQ